MSNYRCERDGLQKEGEDLDYRELSRMALIGGKFHIGISDDTALAVDCMWVGGKEG